MMGETGQGFTSEEQVKQARNDGLTRTWGECELLMSRSLSVQTST